MFLNSMLNQCFHFIFNIFTFLQAIFIELIMPYANRINKLLSSFINRIDVVVFVMLFGALFIVNLLCDIFVAPIDFHDLSDEHQDNSDAGLNEHGPSEIGRDTTLSLLYGQLNLCFRSLLIIIHFG